MPAVNTSCQLYVWLISTHKHKASAYEQVEVFGIVQQTILRGATIYDINNQQHFDALTDNKPQGQALL